MGAGRFLKERDPRIRVIAAEPDSEIHGLEGLKHMASSIVPGIYHEEELDLKIPVSTPRTRTSTEMVGPRLSPTSAISLLAAKL